MAKKDQILILEPCSELHFVGPFVDVVTSTLKLTNPSDSPVIFKVKTTAPKKYCVRPNSGVLEPNKVVNIAVMLQPFDYNPNEKNKHKFMVQTMAVKSYADDRLEELWRDAAPESIMDSKLRCVFDMPGERTVPNNNLDASEVSGDDKSIVNKIVAEPSLKSFSKATHVDPEIKKCAEENKRLKEEIKNLKQENSQLKAEGLRLRSRGATSDASSSSHPAKQQQLESEQPQSPMLYLAVMLTIGLLGIFLGKFVV